MFWVMILTVELPLVAVCACAGAVPMAATAHASHSRPVPCRGLVPRVPGKVPAFPPVLIYAAKPLLAACITWFAGRCESCQRERSRYFRSKHVSLLVDRA